MPATRLPGPDEASMKRTERAERGARRLFESL
jgi:hypothetical protein